MLRYHRADAAKEINPKPFCCDICGVRMSQLGNLNVHMSTHTGEKPFACPVEGCNQRFKNTSECTTHMCIHLGVKPYTNAISARMRFISKTISFGTKRVGTATIGCIGATNVVNRLSYVKETPSDTHRNKAVSLRYLRSVFQTACRIHSAHEHPHDRTSVVSVSWDFTVCLLAERMRTASIKNHPFHHRVTEYIILRTI